jgi:hypothetical protein
MPSCRGTTSASRYGLSAQGISAGALLLMMLSVVRTGQAQRTTSTVLLPRDSSSVRDSTPAALVPCPMAFQVLLVDSVTGAVVPGARGRVTHGAFADTLVALGYVDGQAVVYFAEFVKDSGTYQVAIEHPGYRLWTSDSFAVAPECPGGPRMQHRVQLVPR